MLRIVDNSITLTRGDSAYINIVPLTPSGDVYELESTDRIYFTLRRSPKKDNNSNPPLIEKTFWENAIKIDPKDTQFLNYGKYYYDVELIFKNGDISTLCSGTFTISYEIR